MTFTAGLRALLLTAGMSTDSLDGLYIISVNASASSIGIKTITNPTKLTLTTNANKLTFTNSDGNSATAILLY